MMNARHQPGVRLNVLLTEDRPHAAEHWTTQLPRLLAPQGVAAYVARSGREAIDLAERVQLHAAVIDLSTPLGDDEHDPDVHHGSSDPRSPAGIWLLELFRRLPNQPPVVVVRGPAVSARQFDRLMREALRLDAFSVVNKPVDLEQMLAVFRRLIDRRYRGAWPLS